MSQGVKKAFAVVAKEQRQVSQDKSGFSSVIVEADAERIIGLFEHLVSAETYMKDPITKAKFKGHNLSIRDVAWGF